MAPAADGELQQKVRAECEALADLLNALPPPSWDMDSLCAGWRVREVIAHLTMPARYTTGRFIAEIVRARGNFHRMADRAARRDAELPAGDLVAALRETKLQAWKPPGGRREGALAHAVIHGLDVTTPLGLGRRVPEDRLRVVLADLTKPSSLRYFGIDLSGIELRAGDIGWSHGEPGTGAPLSGDAQDLALLLAGRRLPDGRLHGGPASRFSGTPA